MSSSPRTPSDPTPVDWDLLQEVDPLEVPDLPPERIDPMTVVAAAWGDLVALVAMVTGALAVVLGAGRPVGLQALPWAAALALAWWTVAASVLLTVRRATPGMLMAGVALSDAPRGRALAGALFAGLLGAATLGLAAWPLGGRCLLARVVGTEIVAAGEDGFG